MGVSMGFKLRSAVLATLLLCAGAASAAPAPISAYGQLPNLSEVSISPDGTRLAYIRNNADKRQVWIQPLDGKEAPVFLDFTGKKLRSILWADSEHLIITVSSTTVPRGMEGEREEYTTAQSFDVKTKQSTPLMQTLKGQGGTYTVMNVLAGGLHPITLGGKPFVFTRGYYYPGGRGQYGLFRIDLTTGETYLMSREDRKEASGWILDQTGTIIAEVDFTRYTQHWKLVLYRDGKPGPTVMDVPSPIEGPDLVGLNQDGTALIVEDPPTTGKRSFKQVALKDGAITPWHTESEVTGEFMIDGHTLKVNGVARIVDKADYEFFDPKLDLMWRSVKAAFATATNVDLVDWSEDKTKVIIEVFGPNLGNGYFLVDMAAKKATPIGSAYDNIKEFYVEKWIDYKAADGRTIHAYLTLPNREAKNLPLVVLPHGGPHSRDYPGFDWLSQSLASRGYVVLQPEFRGSDGFGEEWLQAGFHEYGKKMQTDLSDGVRALAAQGLIDSKRVCIFGWSYGGYAALAGATIDTGVYRCAASMAGPADMREMLKGWPHPTMGATGARFWDRFVGIENGDMSKADAISPAKHADKVSIPVLLVHGKDDTVVPYEQSEIMASALKAAGKKFEFVTLDKEDHWGSTGATRLQLLNAVIGFIEANNPPN